MWTSSSTVNLHKNVSTKCICWHPKSTGGNRTSCSLKAFRWDLHLLSFTLFCPFLRCSQCCFAHHLPPTLPLLSTLPHKWPTSAFWEEHICVLPPSLVHLTIRLTLYSPDTQNSQNIVTLYYSCTLCKWQSSSWAAHCLTHLLALISIPI